MMLWQFTRREKLWLRLLALAMLAALLGQVMIEPATAGILRYAGAIGAVAIIFLLALSWRRHAAEDKH